MKTLAIDSKRYMQSALDASILVHVNDYKTALDNAKRRFLKTNQSLDEVQTILANAFYIQTSKDATESECFMYVELSEEEIEHDDSLVIYTKNKEEIAAILTDKEEIDFTVVAEEEHSFDANDVYEY